jgi:hypothetical protein
MTPPIQPQLAFRRLPTVHNLINCRDPLVRLLTAADANLRLNAACRPTSTLMSVRFPWHDLARKTAGKGWCGWSRQAGARLVFVASLVQARTTGVTAR